MNLFLTKEALYQLSYVGNWALVLIREYRAVEIWSGRRDSNSRHPAWKARALPTELLPPTGILLSYPADPPLVQSAWGRSRFLKKMYALQMKLCSSVMISLDLTGKISYIRHLLRLVVGGGFEPPKASPTDLQSVPFGRSGTPPLNRSQKSDSRSQNAFLLFLSSGFWFLAWSWRWDLNPQPADYKSAALPIELRQRINRELYPFIQKNQPIFDAFANSKNGDHQPL